MADLREVPRRVARANCAMRCRPVSGGASAWSSRVEQGGVEGERVVIRGSPGNLRGGFVLALGRCPEIPVLYERQVFRGQLPLCSAPTDCPSCPWTVRDSSHLRICRSLCCPPGSCCRSLGDRLREGLSVDLGDSFSAS